jgi:hypothetical protein
VQNISFSDYSRGRLSQERRSFFNHFPIISLPLHCNFIIMNKYAFVFVILLSTGAQGLAQYAQKGWELGAWAGLSHYFGDLNTSFDLSRPGIAGGLSGRYIFNPRISVGFNANYGRISADDARSKNEFERARNLNFRSNLFEISSQLEFNFLKYVHGDRDYPFSPYLFGGISAFGFNPVTELDGVRYSLRDYGTEGQFFGDEYSLFQLGLVYGMGVKFDINTDWSINIELSARRLFTDYLDDVSGRYPDKDELFSLRGPVAVQLSDRSLAENRELFNIGQAGRQRGNSRDNDSFSFFRVGVMYYFGYLPCPEILRNVW